MKILLDTHTFLWFINDSPELSSSAADLLESDVDLLLSTASLWEIAIKVSLNKLTLPDDYERFIPQQITLNNIEILTITFEHLTVVSRLPFHHRDPFDRLLIAQSMSEKLQIVSADTKLDSYEVDRKW
ncbi:type II toxin-antitoxin system VapC family toxin [Thermoleptolyngbya sichuanensis A183]|uniref:Type II toxin-antitoxin system VapC family toxin n=1 Tax=Thermoleptolyngbya sichuanensis A183 TaxID=2737172 RepID=A0A6M8BDN6_9CYAN|nr:MULTISPECIES: type II toxin-antitoxin system VapC family toxin [Thermoleptolyngbya]QKD80805.1 type II toxin-antitoxin system VapC family toxin [Thermoleptolyngbya sichuanensis A183]